MNAIAEQANSNSSSISELRKLATIKKASPIGVTLVVYIIFMLGMNNSMTTLSNVGQKRIMEKAHLAKIIGTIFCVIIVAIYFFCI